MEVIFLKAYQIFCWNTWQYWLDLMGQMTDLDKEYKAQFLKINKNSHSDHVTLFLSYFEKEMKIW